MLSIDNERRTLKMNEHFKRYLEVHQRIINRRLGITDDVRYKKSDCRRKDKSSEIQKKNKKI